MSQRIFITRRLYMLTEHRLCEFCNRILPLNYTDTYCPSCQEARLFQDVKEFIRENDVNEYQVAEYFEIPLRQVKEWIREGRIEYRERNQHATISGLRCQRCDAPVSFGSLCPKCLKLLNHNVHGYEVQKIPQSSDDKMRFLDQTKKK